MMTSFFNQLSEIIRSSSLETIQIAAIAYLGLLWLSIIIWVTRDSIHRSHSLLFQTFAILINILIPILGVLLYLIIRPGQTLFERYYQEMEKRLIEKAIEEEKEHKGPSSKRFKK